MKIKAMKTHTPNNIPDKIIPTHDSCQVCVCSVCLIHELVPVDVWDKQNTHTPDRHTDEHTRHTHTHRHTTHTHTDRQTHTDTKTHQTNTHTQRQTQTDRHTHTHKAHLIMISPIKLRRGVSPSSQSC